jgi:hypothetical protein
MLLLWWSTLALLGSGVNPLGKLFAWHANIQSSSPTLWESWLQLGPWVGWACAVALALGACCPDASHERHLNNSLHAEPDKRQPVTPDAPAHGAAPSTPWVQPPPYEAAAIELLSLLQQHGRLVDFVMEDLSLYTDTQVAQAAQRVHAGCRQALAQHMRIEAIDDGREGQPIYPKHYATAAYLATHYQQCDAEGQTPVQASVFQAYRPPVLVHRGWKASLCSLKLRGQGSEPNQDEAWRIIVPARLAAPAPQATAHSCHR